jgi:hypothetical protein
MITIYSGKFKLVNNKDVYIRIHKWIPIYIKIGELDVKDGTHLKTRVRWFNEFVKTQKIK